MTRHLVLIHGRSQQGRDPDEAKAEWVDSLREGLDKSHLELPIEEADIHFPFYGDTLMDLIAGETGDQIAEIVVRGYEQNAQARVMLEKVLREVVAEEGITPEQVTAASDPQDAIARGIQNSRPVLALLRALDAHMPGAGAALIALITNDVYQYISNIGLARDIDRGVSEAMRSDAECVVVAHSLGSVVAYNILLTHGPDRTWKVPAFITVGSPLGIGAIRDKLAPIRYPKVVQAWFNAYDKRDVVALRPLTSPWFGVDGQIDNLTMRNPVDDHHGIRGYLSDQKVSRRIYDALTGG
jgi:hypothetical protein